MLRHVNVDVSARLTSGCVSARSVGNKLATLC